MNKSSRDKSGKGSDKKPIWLEIVSIFILVGFAYFLIEGSLVLGFRTTTPVTVVSSNSMNTPHTQDWQHDYEGRGYTPENFPFQDGLQVGDLVFVRGVSSLDEVEVGDVVVFWQGDVGGSKRIIHRVYGKGVEQGRDYITTKGDANNGSGDYEIRIGEQRVVGKAVVSLPYLGYPALGVR